MKTKQIATFFTMLCVLCAAMLVSTRGVACPAPPEINGYLEARAGTRLQNDPYEKDISVAETRMQLECFTYTDRFDLKFKADTWYDGVSETGHYQTQQLWVFTRPCGFMDIKLGRQILTWGTGDLVFLNDLFPKDWQSFFIGRDSQYLKAPSDSVKISFFPKYLNIDVVYTPRFAPDRFINGQYISHWANQTMAGNNNPVTAKTPDQWFRDDETAVRLYKNISNYEAALYGYWGFWKTPSARTPQGLNTFSPLHVYGASVRGNVGKAIANLEIAYYNSVDNPNGHNPDTSNSQMRYLAGYSRDVATELNLSVQYYVEQTLDFYAHAPKTGELEKNEFRHVITVQATKLFMQQTLECVFAMYYSPSDEDAYFRPYLNYKYSDHANIYAGANIFVGKGQNTFFGQFEKNSNIYAAFKYSF